jgi:DDE superfamily endonuclease
VGGFIQNQTPHLKLKYKNPLIYETTISNKINRPVRNINRYKININIFKEQESKFSCEQEFVGGKAYIGANNMQTPHKKPRGGELTKEQKEENKELSSTRRIFGEHVIRLLRIFRVTQETILVIISDLYEGGNNNKMLKRVGSIVASLGKILAFGQPKKV